MKIIKIAICASALFTYTNSCFSFDENNAQMQNKQFTEQFAEKVEFVREILKDTESKYLFSFFTDEDLKEFEQTLDELILCYENSDFTNYEKLREKFDKYCFIINENTGGKLDSLVESKMNSGEEKFPTFDENNLFSTTENNWNDSFNSENSNNLVSNDFAEED